jgi:hypothetical protein
VLAVALLAALAVAPTSGAHSERSTSYPDPDAGSFPEYRTTGTSLVVCKGDSKRRIMKYSGALQKRNLDLLKLCRYSDIQAAVNAASNGYRILVLPGVYQEIPSRLKPEPDPSCAAYYTQNAGGALVPSYEYQLNCPNARNLIAITGDTNGDRVCDRRCNLQIEGTGARPEDVLIQGTRQKMNIIRADRADGIYLKNFAAEFSEDNNIYFVETNGFRLDQVVSRYSQNYGVLSFTSDHGIYENCEASYNGDSGVYPGSGPDRHGMPDIHGHVYGIIIRNCNSHDNTIGYSGTAGNGIWAHDNKFHHNAAGVTTDSFASGHPGMPQDAAKWSDNEIYSNNNNLFDDERDRYCQTTPWEQRTDPTKVCPTFQVPVGTGLLIAGGNDNIVQDNYIYDNWRNGTMLFWVPATLRGEEDPAKNYDTSNNNRHEGNRMGVRPDGTADPNGVDFWWDEEEGVDDETQLGNCWVQSGPTRNVGPGGAAPKSDPLLLPECPGLDVPRPGNSAKHAFLVPCATWDPNTNTDPPGCDWFTLPPEPQP